MFDVVILGSSTLFFPLARIRLKQALLATKKRINETSKEGRHTILRGKGLGLLRRLQKPWVSAVERLD